MNAVQRYAAINPLESLSKEKKIELLHLVDRTARAEDPRVTRVSAALSSIYEEVLVVATDGTLAADIRPLVRLSISVLVEEDGKRERGSCGSGGRFGLDWFFEVVNGDIRAVNLQRSRSSSSCESKCSRGTSRINAGGIGSRLARCVAS